jgi:hypothetical protein
MDGLEGRAERKEKRKEKDEGKDIKRGPGQPRL